MPSAYQNWTLAQAREICRRELMDSGGRWWTDSEINSYIIEWQTQLQQDYEFIWTTSTFTTSLSTITLSDLNPQISRLDAVYWIGSNGGRGWRLTGRNLQDLEVAHNEWRGANADTPREIIQYDSTQMIVWPPLQSLGTFIFEAPAMLSLVADTDTISLPWWTQWSMKPYVCERAYLRLGPNNDITKANKYRVLYQRSKTEVKKLWDQFIPERYRRLKPASLYDLDIIFQTQAGVTGNGGAVPDIYQSFGLAGVIDGINSVFTIPILPTMAKVFKNGLLQTPGGDYNLTGNTITFITGAEPQPDDVLVTWAFIQGV